MYLLLPIAFISGILTVFSPCVLPILPIVLASGIDGRIQRVRGIITGLVISFTIASLLLATIVRLLHIPADNIRFGAVILLIILGLSMVFPKLWKNTQVFIEKYWKAKPIQQQGNGFGSGFLAGVSLGIVWTPCIGPVVATVATLAALDSFSLISVLIIFFYALGTGVPLYLIAKGGRKVTQKLTFFKQNNEQVRSIFGSVILITAVMIYFSIDRIVQAWTLSVLPTSWTLLASTFENSLHVTNILRQLKK
jgi:cytochrome c biogenesis protein CcdA